MSEQTYEERERQYLIKIIEQAQLDWYNTKRIVDGKVTPRFQDHIADTILANGFSYGNKNQQN